MAVRRAGVTDALDRQMKAAAFATTPASKIAQLLDVFGQTLDGIDLTTLSCALGADAKRIRGLIDSARAHGNRIVQVEGAKSAWRLT
ncbi:hypothetical protein DF3PB_3540005 [uncultured Defluviicoccus sp.]|uniref:Uncharacterized protein n=1 Tax=metagenome TaxID=256318 RepID=A0A380TH44_9ZZZZ|nr:hypothetical protein DF3PB_3540005 [uncultured Defluviicoccus sp.]